MAEMVKKRPRVPVRVSSESHPSPEQNGKPELESAFQLPRPSPGAALVQPLFCSSQPLPWLLSQLAKPPLQVVMVQAPLVQLILYVSPLLIVHACEALFNNVLIVRHLPIGVRYSVYAATLYLTLLFGNFGGSDFIYFQF